MHLKRISICGFKSFCDRADFDFGPGVTCIVGPNGCGKSNLVDAFKWVLGEQSARSLRGRQMADMIFNGSSTRRSSSVAQVDLVFDNTDRSLDYDADDVVVSRKLYRSGDSEYLLNQAPARLKDVRDLFMDTGVGVDAYSVVEQGRVDSLLQSSPTERRIIFEEAAGISKYKARRREAERKLERTQQNLLRIEDIIQELEKRLRSVKLQAGKARSYKQLEDRLNELRSSYALAEFHRFTDEIARLTTEAHGQTDCVTSLKTEIDRHGAQEAEMVTRLDRLAEDINAADSSFVQTKSELLAREERIETARGRAEEQRVLLERVRERHAADSSRIEECRRELASLQESAATLETESAELRACVEQITERDRALARELTQSQAVLEDEKAGIIELLRRSARLHNEIIRLNTHRESLVGQKGRLSERDAMLTSELGTTLEQRVQLDRRIHELDSLIAEETEKLEEKKTEAARVDTLRQRLIDGIAEAKQQRSAMASRRELLEDLQQRMEGVGVAARRILDRKRSEEPSAALQQIEGLVADVFETDVAQAAVIEAALGEAAKALVVTHGGALLTDEELFGDLPGRLDMLCLDRLPPVINEHDFREAPGFAARAIDMVRYDDRFDHLARHLLGKTVVVETLAVAMAMADHDVAGHRFVTLAGEVVESDGSVRIGPPSTGVGLISRRSELREIATQATTLETRISTLHDQLNRTQAEAGHLDGVQQELRTAIYESNTARVEANAALQNITETINRLTREQPLIAQEVALLEQEIGEVHERSASEGKTLAQTEAENTQRESLVAQHQARIDDVVASRQAVQEELTQAKVSAGQLAEKRSAAIEKATATQRVTHELENTLANAERDAEECESRIADAAKAIAQGQEDLASLRERIDHQEARCTELRRGREGLRSEQEMLAATIKSARQRLEEAERRVHEHEMALAQTNVRRDDLVSRIADELDINLIERHEAYQHEEQDWAEVETEIAELRRKLDRLGNVNLDAIKELEELEARHQFLTTQRDDLTTSHRQLEQLIERLNAESRDRFEKHFQEIRENFRALFRKLFGGGRADIILEDPNDVLECGIEIVAQPPGKELQAISLMSGGEKSLTAIALLMSIFKCRPAPFAILDEVDAALDEANNERFNRIIQEFVTEAQFLLITHSKWTMNIADRLYGITMQEPGISTRVSVEFEGKSEVA